MESGGGVSVNGVRIQGREGSTESGGGGDGSESDEGGGCDDESAGGDVESVGGGAELSGEESGGEAESAGGEELGEPSESDILLLQLYFPEIKHKKKIDPLNPESLV